MCRMHRKIMIKQNGNIVLSLLLIVVVIVGGFYLYNSYIKPKLEPKSNINHQTISQTTANLTILPTPSADSNIFKQVAKAILPQTTSTPVITNQPAATNQAYSPTPTSVQT